MAAGVELALVVGREKLLNNLVNEFRSANN